MSLLRQYQSFATSMIRRYGGRGWLRRNGVNRDITCAILEWSPHERGLHLIGSRRVLISAIDPITGAELAVPPDHEQDTLVFEGALYRIPNPDVGPRSDGVTVGYHDYEVVYSEPFNVVDFDQVVFRGAGDLAANLTTLPALLFAANFRGAGDLSADFDLAFELSALFVGAGDLSAEFDIQEFISFTANFVGAGDLTADLQAEILIEFLADFAGAGDLDAALSAGIREPDELFGADLEGWWKADVGITISTGNQVSAWADQSGNSNTLSQATSSRQPHRNLTGLNGLPTIAFNPNNDGTGSFMATGGSAVAMGGDCSIFMVCEFRGLGFALNGSHILGYIANGSALSYDNANSILFFYNPNGSNDVQALKNGDVDLANTIAASTIYRLGLTHDGTTLRYYEDGAEVDNDAETGTLAATGQITVGSSQGALDNTRARVDISEIVLVRRDATTAEIAELDAYFVDKWGL